jgi:hypothetical protein
MLVPHNHLAFFMVLVGYPAGVGLALLLGQPNPANAGFVFGGPIITYLDMRYRRKVGQRHWFHPHRGGHLMFIPVWILGVIWIILGLLL